MILTSEQHVDHPFAGQNTQQLGSSHHHHQTTPIILTAKTHQVPTPSTKMASAMPFRAIQRARSKPTKVILGPGLLKGGVKNVVIIPCSPRLKTCFLLEQG